MEVIKTQSFELAVSSKGDKDSSKVVICLPGRLDTKDYQCFISHMEYLAERGFYALSFDPPGTWESPGGIELFTTTNYIKAVNELIAYYGSRQTLLIGHSRGGQVAMLVGTANPVVEGLVMINASYGPPSAPDPEEVQDGTLVEYRDLPPGTKRTHEQKKFLMPLTYFIDGEKYDPKPALREFEKPKLIFYGTEDRFTTPAEVKEIFESIPEPKMIHELQTEHDYRLHPEVVDEVNKILGEFLEKYLKI